MLRARPFLPSLGLLVSLAASPGAAADGAREPIAHVVAVEGRATAALPGQEPRVLACDDPVHPDERLVTAPGAKLVVARDGRHAHLGPEALLVLGRDAAGDVRFVLARGEARILDASDAPASRISTPAGDLSFAGADLELHHASGALEICTWSGPQPGVCRSVEPSGALRLTLHEGPRVALGLGAFCEERWGFSSHDFMSPPAVAAGRDPAFEPVPDEPEPGCRGDECSGGPSLEPGPSEVVYSVEPPPVFVPFP